MGQASSLLSEGKVIDIKRQAPAIDIIGSGVWYFCPKVGRNLWANRAALDLYGLPAEAFCKQQQAAWQAAAGEVAAELWQRSNAQLLEALATKDAASASAKLSGYDVTVHMTSTSCHCTSTATGSASSCTVHAGFLPLPAGIANISARLSTCLVLHKQKVLPAYIVQVVSVQKSTEHFANGMNSSSPSGMVAAAQSAMFTPGRQLADLQMELARQFSEPAMLDVRSGLPLKQQQGSSQVAAAASSGIGSGDGAAHVLLRVDEAAAPAVPEVLQQQQQQSRLVQQSSASMHDVPAKPAAATPGGLDLGSMQSGVQAAATSLRLSFEQQASVSKTASAHCDRSRSFEFFKTAASTRQPHNCTIAPFERHSSCSIDKQHGHVNGSSSLRNSQMQGASASADVLGPMYMRKDSNNFSVVLSAAYATPEAVAARQLRLIEMCDNHAMFQFLFDAQGKLLSANKRAMNNMREHLGEHSTYTLPQYLSIGQCDGGLSADQIFAVITNAIFVNQEPCFRLPQLRYSKRRPGKCRWVLYEIWAMDDPVTGQPALLVTEQNITQVKLVEEQYSSHMRQLETQLEEALIQQQHAEAVAAAAEAAAAAAAAAAKDGIAAECSLLYPHPAIDTCSAADKTLQLLDRLLQGSPVSVEEAEMLREALLTGSSNLHAPLYLDEQVLQHTQALKYTPDVGANLLQMLSNKAWGNEADSETKDMPHNVLDEEEGDSSLTAETNVIGSADSSSFTQQHSAPLQLPRQVVAAAQPSESRGSSSGTATGVGAGAESTTEASAAVAACTSPGQSEGPTVVSPQEQQQKQSVILQQHQRRSSVSSAYPVVTADSFPAAGAALGAGGSTLAAAAGSMCAATAIAAPALAVPGSGNSTTRTSLSAAARAVLSLSASPTLELDAVLARVDDWQFDSFELTTATNNRPLSVLAFFLIKKANLVQKCGLDETRLARWLVCVEEGYPPNPYHNRSHAADVTRNVHLLMTQGGVGAAVAGGWGGAEDMAVLAVYLAAVMHDFEHRGVNNDFLVRSCDALALLYNDRSPHENHHLAASWGLLVEHNFLRGVSHKNKELVRRLTIDMVLATDMKQHFAIHGLFQSKIHVLAALSTQRSSMPAGSTSGALPQLVTVTSGLSSAAAKAAAGSRAESPSISTGPSRHHMQLVTSSTLSGSSFSGGLPPAGTRSGSLTGVLTGVPEGTPAAADEPAGAAGVGNAATSSNTSSRSPGPAPPAASSTGGSFVLARLRSSSSMIRRGGLVGSSAADSQAVWEEDTETRSLYLQVALKASDLGHLCAAREVHKKWVRALEEENFRQGDRERAAGLPVSPLMDRTKQGITKSQVGFFDIVALPLFTSLAQRFPGAMPMLDAVLDNYAMWVEHEREDQKQQLQQQC